MARKVEVAGITGPLWFTGWLFTIGYMHFGFGRALIALILWPYYLGASLGA